MLFAVVKKTHKVLYVKRENNKKNIQKGSEWWKRVRVRGAIMMQWNVSGVMEAICCYL